MKDKLRQLLGILLDPLVIVAFVMGLICTVLGCLMGWHFRAAPEEPVKPVIQEVEVPAETEPTIELAEEQVPALMENADGEVEEVILPTVDSVDGGEIEDVENYARGAYYDVSTPTAFYEAVIGKCVVEGNYYGAQCVSLARAFWSSYAGRSFSTCGTGAAKGAFNCIVENAGDEFIPMDDPYGLQTGDIAIFDYGDYGHVGFVMGPPQNGYVALLGQNQGGKACEEGGSAANVINISLKGFIGAYRPKIYITDNSTEIPNTSAGREAK